MSDSNDGTGLNFSIRDAWYVLCASRELGRRPLARRLMNQPLVLFRDASEQPGALLDRCAHRNVPLSAGRMSGGNLECAYHGWQFDRLGACKCIPGLDGDPALPARKVPHHATREHDGYVWVYARPNVCPTSEPFRLAAIGRDGYTTVQRAVDADAGVFAVLENALDVPHTAFVHRGLFRGGATNTVTAVVTRSAHGVQTEYIGEPRPKGIAARILSPRGGVVRHYDRFFLPAIAQVEYAIGDDTHFIVTALCTPVDDFSTRLFATVTFRTRLPGWLVKPVLNPFAMRIFAQDATILRLQSGSIQRFGGARFASTEIDLMGPQIMRLMRLAQEGKPTDDGREWRREVQFRA
jgi:phenylpropionate dioxygenase-like ring-hydroxylating dioxygenase large terminal subunit